MAVIHTFKINDQEITKELTPIRAIRANCIDCSGGSATEVKDCAIKTCPCYPFRMGKSPGREKIVLSDEERKRRSDRFKQTMQKHKAQE